MGHECCQTKQSCCGSSKQVSTPKEKATCVTRTMTIDDIFENFPEYAQKLAQVLTNRGLHCVGCRAATYETLEVGCLTHGLTEADIDQLVDDLNAVLLLQIDENTITLTPEAASKFRYYLQSQGKEGHSLRFGLEAAGCNGFGYVLGFSEKPEDTDLIFQSEGIDIHVDMGFADQLVGTEIDFVDSLAGGGFKISNKKARSSCGCGKSHGY